jgi:hypothetical protein
MRKSAESWAQQRGGYPGLMPEDKRLAQSCLKLELSSASSSASWFDPFYFAKEDRKR